MSKHEVDEVETTNQTEDEKTVEESVFMTKISTMTTQVEELLKTLKTITVDLKTMKKEYSKLEKKTAALEKSKGRKKRAREERAREEGGEKVKKTGGFNKPTKISVELSNLLDLEEGQLVSRPEVTALLSKYVKKNDLKNGGKIDLTRPGGEKLAKILNIPVDTKLTYFNLQKFLKHHYISTKNVEEVEEVEKVEKVEKAEETEEVEKVEEVKPRRRRHVEASV